MPLRHGSPRATSGSVQPRGWLRSSPTVWAGGRASGACGPGWDRPPGQGLPARVCFDKSPRGFAVPGTRFMGAQAKDVPGEGPAGTRCLGHPWRTSLEEGANEDHPACPLELGARGQPGARAVPTAQPAPPGPQQPSGPQASGQQQNSARDDSDWLGRPPLSRLRPIFLSTFIFLSTHSHIPRYFSAERSSRQRLSARMPGVAEASQQIIQGAVFSVLPGCGEPVAFTMAGEEGTRGSQGIALLPLGSPGEGHRPAPLLPGLLFPWIHRNKPGLRVQEA